jgi:hypothetical protein
MIFIAYLLIGLLFWKMLSALRRLDAIELKLLQQSVTARAALAELPSVTAPITKPEPPASAATPATEPKSEQPTDMPTLPPTPPQAQSGLLDEMLRGSGGWEELIGRNLLNKLGALVLVIGIALFLSYSFANMRPAGRAFTSLAVSAALLVSGVFVETKERYRAFSRGIMASGWAGLYFTSYAMYALPEAQIIESPVVGTMLMIAVAISMVGHSLRYRVQSLTALAFGCIFAALALSPLNTLVAISLIPLAVAMLYLARRLDWNALAIFAAGGTYAVFLTRPASDAPLWTIQMMLFIFWAMFEGFDLLRPRGSKSNSPMHQALYVVNALAGLGASVMLWDRLASDSMWLFSSGAALLYLASAWIRFALNDETYHQCSLAISALLAGLAIFERVPGLWASIGLMLEAEILFFAANRLRVPTAKVLSWVGFAAAFFEISRHFGESIVLGGIRVANTSPSLGVIATLFYLNRYLSSETFWSYFASTFVTLITLQEGERSRDGFGLIQLAWSALLFELGFQKKLREFRLQSYAVAGIGFGITGVMVAFRSPAWPAALGAVVFYAHTLRSQVSLPHASERERKFVSVGGSLATTILIALFVHRAVPVEFEAVALMAAATALVEFGLRALPMDLSWQGRMLSSIPVLMVLFDAPMEPGQRIFTSCTVAALHFWMHFRARSEPLSPGHGIAGAFVIATMLFNEVSGGMLTLSWSLEGIGLLAIGFIVRDRWLRLSGLALLLLCIGKVFFYDLRNLETMYRILSFIGLGVILLAVSWIYTRFKEQVQRLL